MIVSIRPSCYFLLSVKAKKQTPAKIGVLRVPCLPDLSVEGFIPILSNI
jgi:hypothetical protein